MYVRGITDVHDRKSVAEAFSAFGPVLKVDLIHAKGIAFVDFSSADGALKAVGASLTVGGATLLIEERKRGGGSGGNKNGNNGNNGKSSGAQRSGSAPRQRGPPKPKQDKQPAPAR